MNGEDPASFRDARNVTTVLTDAGLPMEAQDKALIVRKFWHLGVSSGNRRRAFPFLALTLSCQITSDKNFDPFRLDGRRAVPILFPATF